MHRKEALLKLAKEWLELELESTCVSVSTYSSVNISKRGNQIGFVRKTRGYEDNYGYIELDDAKVPVKIVVLAPHDVNSAIAIILFALEKAIEAN